MNELQGLPDIFWVRWPSEKQRGKQITKVAKLKSDTEVELFKPVGMTKVGIVTYKIEDVTCDRAVLRIGRVKRRAEAWWGDRAKAIWMDDDAHVNDATVKRGVSADGTEGYVIRAMYDSRAGFQSFLTSESARQLWLQFDEHFRQ